LSIPPEQAAGEGSGGGAAATGRVGFRFEDDTTEGRIRFHEWIGDSVDDHRKGSDDIEETQGARPSNGRRGRT